MEADASGMICAKCEAANATGDTFCGSCGAFAELKAEEAAAPALRGHASRAGDPGVARLRIRTLDWYAAKKISAAGSPSPQAGISEIRLCGIPMTP